MIPPGCWELGWGLCPEALQTGAPGPRQKVLGLNVATKGQEQPVVITAGSTLGAEPVLPCDAPLGALVLPPLGQI